MLLFIIVLIFYFKGVGIFFEIGVILYFLEIINNIYLRIFRVFLIL